MDILFGIMDIDGRLGQPSLAYPLAVPCSSFISNPPTELSPSPTISPGELPGPVGYASKCSVAYTLPLHCNPPSRQVFVSKFCSNPSFLFTKLASDSLRSNSPFPSALSISFQPDQLPLQTGLAYIPMYSPAPKVSSKMPHSLLCHIHYCSFTAKEVTRKGKSKATKEQNKTKKEDSKQSKLLGKSSKKDGRHFTTKCTIQAGKVTCIQTRSQKAKSSIHP